MKKPKITKGPWDYGFYVGFGTIRPKGVNESLLNKADTDRAESNAKAISAVPEIIGALIAAYLLIDDMPINEREERHLRVYNKMADALEKAGCEL